MASLDAKLMGDGKKDNYVSSSESEGEGETPPSLPAPVRDGLPQVSADLGFNTSFSANLSLGVMCFGKLSVKK